MSPADLATLKAHYDSYQPPAESGSAAIRKPGNWATHILPIAGSILGGLVGGIPGAAIGGSLAKAGENKLEHQSLGNGVLGQGLLGGASELGGQIAAPYISKAISPVTGLIGRLLGRGGTEAASNAIVDTSAQGLGDSATQGASRASELVPGSKSSFIDSLMSRYKPSAPVVAEGSGAVEVGQGGNIIKLGGKTGNAANTAEAASQLGGATEGRQLATAATPYHDAVSQYLESKGLTTPENAFYNKGAEFTASPRNLDQAFRGSLKAPDMVNASNKLLDTLGHGGAVDSQFAELPDIHQTVTNDLKGVLADNTNKVEANNLIDTLNKIPESEFNIKPLDGMHPNQQLMESTARAVPGSTYQQVDGALNKAGDIVKRYTDAEGNISASGLLSINQEVGDLIKPSQWNALRGIGDAAISPVDQANFKIWQETRQALEQVSPEASNILKVQSLTGHELPKALQAGIADTGTARVGIRGTMRGGIPGSAKLFQQAQSGIGRALQGVGGAAPQLAETAQAVVPQILGHNVGDSVSAEQEAQKNAEAATQTPDLTAPSADIQDTLTTVDKGNPLGIDLQKVKQAELTDLVTTGGKNIPALNKIESVISATQGPTLSAGGTQQAANYQNSLQALQGLNSVFNSGASKEEVQQAITQILPYLTKATGLAKKDLLAIMPSATEDQTSVNAKLSDIKDLIDQKSGDALQTSVTKSSPSDQSSLIASLLGQGA